MALTIFFLASRWYRRDPHQRQDHSMVARMFNCRSRTPTSRRSYQLAYDTDESTSVQTMITLLRPSSLPHIVDRPHTACFLSLWRLAVMHKATDFMLYFSSFLGIRCKFTVYSTFCCTSLFCVPSVLYTDINSTFLASLSNLHSWRYASTL